MDRLYPQGGGTPGGAPSLKLEYKEQRAPLESQRQQFAPSYDNGGNRYDRGQYDRGQYDRGQYDRGGQYGENPKYVAVATVRPVFTQPAPAASAYQTSGPYGNQIPDVSFVDLYFN